MTPNKETYYFGIVYLSLHEYCTAQFLPCKILSVNFLIAVYFSHLPDFAYKNLRLCGESLILLEYHPKNWNFLSISKILRDIYLSIFCLPCARTLTDPSAVTVCVLLDVCFSLQISRAVTVHKSQGLTLSRT